MSTGTEEEEKRGNRITENANECERDEVGQVQGESLRGARETGQGEEREREHREADE